MWPISWSETRSRSAVAEGMALLASLVCLVGWESWWVSHSEMASISAGGFTWSASAATRNRGTFMPDQMSLPGNMASTL